MTAIKFSSSSIAIIAERLVVLLFPFELFAVLEEVAAFIATEFPLVVGDCLVEARLVSGLLLLLNFVGD